MRTNREWRNSPLKGPYDWSVRRMRTQKDGSLDRGIMDEAKDRQGRVERAEGPDVPTPIEAVGGQILVYRDGSLNL